MKFIYHFISDLICIHGSQPWILAPPSPTRAEKGGSCPGKCFPTALQNRVQPTIQQCRYERRGREWEDASVSEMENHTRD